MAVQMQEVDRKRETLEEEEYSPWCLSTWPPCWSERMRPSCRLSTIRSQPNLHTRARAHTYTHILSGAIFFLSLDSKCRLQEIQDRVILQILECLWTV
jgi:hypothetical protein